jgi:hypothetical protein
MAFGVLRQHDGEQVAFRVDGHLHDGAPQFLTLPNRVAAQRINRFNSSARAFFKAEQQKVGSRNGRDIVFIEGRVLPAPENVAGHAVNRVDGLLRAGNHGPDIGCLIETDGVVELCRPGLGSRGEANRNG